MKKVANPGPVDSNRTVRVSKHKSISTRAKPLEKQRSVLGEPKYGPGSEPHCKAGSVRYPSLYKALFDETSRTKRIDMVRVLGVSLYTRNQ